MHTQPNALNLMVCLFISHHSLVILTNILGPSALALGIGTAAIGSSIIGTAAGVSISVIVAVSFTTAVSMASVLCYISRQSHNTSNPATVSGEVITTRKVVGDPMEMNMCTTHAVSLD